jgi:hypothetical protein
MKARLYIITIVFMGIISTKLYAQADYVVKDTAYVTSPNNIALNTYYANIEDAEGICGNEGKQLRIRGLKDGGYTEFTVPDAETVTITIKGKSSAKDRIVRIYRDNVLIREISGLDADNCAEFSENIHRNTPVTYKITGGDENSTKPIAITSIMVEKYSDALENATSEIQTNQFDAYPNPVKDILNVKLPDEATYSIAIISLAGNTVLEQKISGQSSFPISVANLSEGIYILRIISDSEKGVLMRRIIKQ